MQKDPKNTVEHVLVSNYRVALLQLQDPACTETVDTKAAESNRSFAMIVYVACRPSSTFLLTFASIHNRAIVNA